MALVLVVEDNPCVLEAVGGYCRALGHDVVGVGSFHEALDVLDTPCDLAIVDQCLDDGHKGVDVLERLRCRHPASRRVLISGVDCPRQSAPPWERFLRKPFSMSAIWDLLEEETQ